MENEKMFGKFRRIETGISGLWVIEPTVFEDARGYFMETFAERDFAEMGIKCKFVQDNQSASTKGVLRGLHFQKTHPQAKLVRVVSGKVWDVAVDLRPESATFGKYYGVELSAENKRQFFIPRGFAHGFVVLSETAEFVYKCDDFYTPGDEGGIIWNDAEIGINWPVDGIYHDDGAVLAKTDLILSEKDQKWPSFKQIKEEQA